MTTRIGAFDRRSAIAVRHVVPAVLVVGVLLWIGLVAIRGGVLALQSTGIPIAGEGQRTYNTSETVWAAALVYLVCFEAAVTSRRFRPAATLPITFAIGAVVVLAGAVGMGSGVSLVTVLAIVAVSWLLGNAVLHRLVPPPDVPIVRVPIAVGLGLGLLGLLLFLLAAFKVLNAATVLGGVAILLLVLVISDRDHLGKDVARLRSWHPPTPTWLETVVIGLTVGFVAFAILETFAPETATDAMWQHLPIARDIWRSGSVSEFPLTGVSLSPIQGHLLYAVAYGFGGMTGAKLVHTMVGLGAILGIAGIGWLGAGRIAGAIGAATIATMPVVAWELGHAFTDFFPIFFTVIALLCILLWQRDGMLVWLLVAGALAGFGFTAKLNMGLVIVALAAAIFLVGRRPWQWRERVLALFVFGLGAAVIVAPWFLRGYAITGTVPGLSGLIELIARIAPEGLVPAELSSRQELAAPVDPHTFTEGRTAGGLQELGMGHSPVDLVLAPWTMTFHGEEFGFPVYGYGEVGIMLLLLLPFALFVPRTRSMALLAITAVFSYVAWWFTPFQILRHLLPTLAIAAALSGIGLAHYVATSRTRTRQILALAAQAGVIIGLIAAPLLYIPNQRTEAPVDLLLGKETTAEYLIRKVPAASALLTAGRLVPPDATIGYIGRWSESAQIYSEARLAYFGVMFKVDPLYANFNAVHLLGTAPDEVFTNLDRLGIRYIIWDRGRTNAADFRSTLLSTEFLSNYTRILEGDRGGYLFEILPGSDSPWSIQGPNLLKDPALDSVGDYGPWTTTGQVDARPGGVSMRAGSSLAQTVSVSGGSPYLLVASATCSNEDSRAELTFRWFDDRSNIVEINTDQVFPGTEGSEQFLWHRAPQRATSVSAELASRQCKFTDAALYSPN